MYSKKSNYIVKNMNRFWLCVRLKPMVSGTNFKISIFYFLNPKDYQSFIRACIVGDDDDGSLSLSLDSPIEFHVEISSVQHFA